MGVPAFEIGANFLFRVFKYNTYNPSIRWGNTYEATANRSGVLDDLLSLLDAIKQFEVSIHMNATVFAYGTVSTWEPDSHPYDPEAFVSVPFPDTQGGRSGEGDLEADEVCWWADRHVETGRRGKLFYRGALGENEVQAPAGSVMFADFSTMASIMETAVGGSGISNYMGYGESYPLTLTMVAQAQAGVSVRIIEQLQSNRPIIVKRNHKYFDVGPSTGGGGGGGMALRRAVNIGDKKQSALVQYLAKKRL